MNDFTIEQVPLRTGMSWRVAPTAMADDGSNVRQYYYTFFTRFPDNALFKVYDLELDKFVAFPGNQTSLLMNKHTVANEIGFLSIDEKSVDSLVVFAVDDEGGVDFAAPLMIGSKDGWKEPE